MLLKTLYIAKEEYGPDKGKYKGEATFSSVSGEVKVRLGQEASHAMIRIVAEQLVEETKAVASLMTSQVIESATLPQLEADL